ncbi:protein-L-isoaspartate O-methyltransferase [Hyphomicrobium sp. xq]|uniref:Protein-L-isoaspartate O-methyltransferase n=1 Tax=Hyphomicrobium album TaxID=2665159 RepID=A0A6I3KQH0_9HYPH|nr:protein-L-isoaspartate O-methyltransferase [Hyphomicrobium album]MTD96062.1 protein-L-isoaspartate O-methyltransferase [Hyphomicrobium album]
MVDVATQRLNMVDSQVLTSDVTDRRILRAMRELPRERFVPGPMAALAYIDEAVPISPAGSDRRWLLAPRIEAKLLQLADVGADDSVLVVGAGTGYTASILAGMARAVLALESDDKLAVEARRNLAELALTNVKVDVGILVAGCTSKAPFDAIVLPGAVSWVPDALFDQLKDGGRLVAVVTEGGIGKATLWRRLGRSVDSWGAFDATAPMLPGFAKTTEFVL